MQNEYLMHFNPFHDPKNGQFTSGGLSSSGVFGSLRRRLKAPDAKRPEDTSKTEAPSTNASDSKKLLYDAAKQKALKEGNATEVLKFKNDLSIQELQNAFNRINTERNLMRISKEELDTGKGITEKFFDAINKGANYINTASSLIEATKRFANNVSKKDDAPLSKKWAEELLKAIPDSDAFSENTISETVKYLDKVTKLERLEKIANG